jgi:PAS domain S-box-containing protein
MNLRVLIIEDSVFDAQMLVSILRTGGNEVTSERLETAEAMRAALANRKWDVILADYNMPQFDALAALRILQESKLDVPFIIVSGGIGEDTAVAAMKAGANDYLMKGNLHRLVPAVERELRDATNRAAQRKAEQAQQESELRYRLLWENSPDAIVLLDRSGTIQFANPAVQDLFGYPPEEVIGQSVTLLQPHRARGLEQLGIERYLRLGLRNFRGRAHETVGLRQDGAEIPIEISFGDMEWAGHHYLVGFIRDITERKRQEKEIQESRQAFLAAREIQQRLFPKSPPRLPAFDIAGASFPAEAASGDYFDYLPMLNDCWALVVGDVTGHGVGPAMLMAETRAYLRLLASRRDDVGDILTLANGVLAHDMGDDRFVTLFLARLDPRARSLVYASAGHPSGFVLDSRGEVKVVLPRTGVPLGVLSETAYSASHSIPLAAGDLLLMLTDGVLEAATPDHRLFGGERVLEVAARHRTQSAQEIVQHLYAAARQFAQGGPQDDDITVIVTKVL